MNSKRILVVDDDALMRQSVKLLLGQHGYEATTADSAEAALDLVNQLSPDLILLDIGLPGMDGLEAVRHFQNQTEAPVLFVSARRRELDAILALEMGGTAYVTKPFNPDLLVAQVKALLRQSRPTEDRPLARQIEVGDLIIDQDAHTVAAAGKKIKLAAKEFSVLLALARKAGHVVSVDELLNDVWGPGFEGESQVVYVHIRWLREKIEADPKRPQRIITVRGFGYKLIDPQEEQLTA